ncbi:Gfo/Idh/MocA family oxidoreductase [Pelomonas sp. P7]|uniref:Gfo/Idh/MocA family oxidoreductase n=1 Tax=Pelomonas caseinilytica TaxID=2906763 RepID=A0ABS8XHX5_9BURK|nr:Gfo/Idh/MocA family oxidoreductase [Pelomonas sp. P7]MCE4538169.1 Gfo/Idh/MocA family oxidoreductase [Pelomonas sp. P7]
MIDPKQLTCAVIGAGRMGVRHVQAAKQLGMQVVGIMDVVAETAKAACKSEGLPESAAFNDAREMLARTRPQAVVVATTAPSHCDLVIAAADAGTRYILCEKPLASSLEEADRMLAACERAGAQLAVNHQMRFMPNYFRVKALIGTERIGPLVAVQVAGSNFGLAMNGSHYFEMFRYMTGRDIHAVQAWFDDVRLTNPRGPQFDDRAGQVRATTADGSSLFMDFSAGAGHGLQCTYICRYAQITVDELAGEIRITARKDEYRELPTTRYGMPADIERIAIEPVEVVAPTISLWKAMLSGETFPQGRDAGLHALRCLVAAHASHARQGSAVALADTALSPSQHFDWA